MASKKNKRKFAAVLLGIVGVAGLSVASASQLTVDAQTETAFGTDVFAPCQDSGDAVKVDYAYNNAFKISAITVSEIDPACVGETVKVQLEDAGDAIVADPASTALAASAISVTFPVANGPSVETDIKTVTVVIG